MTIFKNSKIHLIESWLTCVTRYLFKGGKMSHRLFPRGKETAKSICINDTANPAS